jgi:hypothetical protein
MGESRISTRISAKWQLHYIPVSQLYQEIYNIHAFFSGPTAAMTAAANSTRSQFQPASTFGRSLNGDDELRKIATAGRLGVGSSLL